MLGIGDPILTDILRQRYQVIYRSPLKGVAKEREIQRLNQLQEERILALKKEKRSP